MRAVSQARCYWSLVDDRLGNWDLYSGSKENDGSRKHHMNGLKRMESLAYSNDVIHTVSHTGPW